VSGGSRRYVVKRIIFELEPEPCTEEQEGQSVRAKPAPEPLTKQVKNNKMKREGFKLDDVPPYEDLLRAVRSSESGVIVAPLLLSLPPS